MMRIVTLNRLISFDSMSGSLRTIEGYKYAISKFYMAVEITDHREFLDLENETIENKNIFVTS